LRHIDFIFHTTTKLEMLKGQIENQLNTSNAPTGALLQKAFSWITVIHGEEEKTEQYRQEIGLTTAGKPRLLPEHQGCTGTGAAVCISCGEFCHGHGLLGDRMVESEEKVNALREELRHLEKSQPVSDQLPTGRGSRGALKILNISTQPALSRFF